MAPMSEEETVRKLEQLILDRLLKTEIPPFYSNFQVTNGTLVCTVDHEFEATLGLTQTGMDSPWAVLRLDIFVEADDSSSRKRKQGVSVALDEAIVPNEVTPKTIREAYKPKPQAVLYLLRIVQERLSKSKQPLVDLYNVLHSFCTSLCIKILEAQAHLLRSHQWKAGYLKVVKGTSHNVLDMKHWNESCSLRVCQDPKLRDGQLYLELDPPVDTTACRSSVSEALARKPSSLRNRSLVLGESSARTWCTEDAFIDGLCPTSLNIEKVLLVGAMARAESVLNRLGLRLDELLFGSNVLSSIVSIISNGSFVSLQVDLPVSKCLSVTVEIRSGNIILNYLRQGYESAATRRWGTTWDSEILTHYEKQINAISKSSSSRVDEMAQLLDSLCRMLNVHAVLESFEIAAETRGLKYRRSNPFPSKVHDSCLFIHLDTWAANDCYLVIAAVGVAPALFQGTSFTATTNQLECSLLASKEDVLTIKTLDEFSSDEAVSVELGHLMEYAWSNMGSTRYQKILKPRFNVKLNDETRTLDPGGHLISSAFGKCELTLGVPQKGKYITVSLKAPILPDMVVGTCNPFDLANVVYSPPNSLSWNIPEERLVKINSSGIICNIDALESDLISLAKMQFLIQSLRSVADSNMEISFGKPVVKIVRASHSGVALKCRNESVTLDAIIGMKNSEFKATVLNISGAPMIDLPWTHEINKLLNSFIGTTPVEGLGRQLAASLCLGLPILDPLNAVLAASSERMIHGWEAPPVTPQEAGKSKGGEKKGGKVGLNMSIQKKDRVSRGLCLVPLSHLKFKLLVGEKDQLDIQITSKGCLVSGNRLVDANSIVSYDEFPTFLTKCMDSLFK